MFSLSVSQSPPDGVLGGVAAPLCVRPGLLLLQASFALLAVVVGVLLLLLVPLVLLGLPVPLLLLDRCRRRANCAAVGFFGGPMLFPPTLLLFTPSAADAAAPSTTLGDIEEGWRGCFPALCFPAALRRDRTWGLRERARLDTVEPCAAGCEEAADCEEVDCCEVAREEVCFGEGASATRPAFGCDAEAVVGPARHTRVSGVRGPLLVVSVAVAVAVVVVVAGAEVSWSSWRLASSSWARRAAIVCFESLASSSWVHWARTVARRAAIVCFESSSSFCLRMATLRKELVLWWGHE